MVVGSEGGYSTDPQDKGNWTGGEVGSGEMKGTKYGISAASFPYLDIENLTLEDAKRIYYNNYWIPSGVATMSPGAAYVYFDAAINSGLGGARQLLEGANTVADYLANREALYGELARSNPNYGAQLNGWMNRLEDVRQNALRLEGYN